METPTPAQHESVPWVTRVIVGVNVLLYSIDYLYSLIVRRGEVLRDLRTGATLTAPLPPIAYHSSFSYFTVFQHHEWWRWITCAFVHANLMHIAMNMMGLFLAGPIVEERVGRWKFLVFYLLCALAGPMMHVVLTMRGILAFNEYTPLMGASAAIYGCLVAAALLSPREVVEIAFPPVDVQLWKLVLGLVGLAVVMIYFHANNAGGEAGHLGGAVMGLLLIWVWKRFQGSGFRVQEKRG